MTGTPRESTTMVTMSSNDPTPDSAREFVRDVRADLIAEQDQLDALVAGLSPEQWAAPTPSPRWSVADQIAHLAYFDDTATLAIKDPDAFRSHVAELAPVITGTPEDADDLILGPFRAMAPGALLQAWRTNRQHLADASAYLHDDERVIWYGPSMGAKSFLTARLMEAWAHGQDVVDTVGAEREATDRLRHIAQLGFITRKWSYANRGLEAPSTPVRVELTAPSGRTVAFGPDDAEQSVAGDMLDFCLVVTQRRHVDDTSLRVEGADARDWMTVAQAFAGAPTDGPASAAG